jgi:cobalt-zinc-cadmium efflux system membrane fusion protein
MNPRTSSVVAALVLAVPALTIVVLVGGCRPSQAIAEAASPQTAPPGQVWLAEADVKAAKISSQLVGPQVVEDTVLTSGTVTLDDQRSGHVFSPVTGRVIKILAQLGEQVKAGQPLATIESPDIGSAVSDSHKAEADLIAAEHNLRRKKDLLEQQAASSADVEIAEDGYRNAKAELERARQKQFLLRVGNVDTVTQTYTLPSPIDGEILLRNINPGIEVQGQYSGGSAPELFTIGELDRVWVLGDVYEIDMGRVHVGTPAKVTVLAYPGKVFEGKVDWLSGALDPATRTAKVRCTFDNPEKMLRPSMYATVRIAVDQRKALAIPRDALLRLGEYKMVFVELGESDGRVRYERLPVDVVESDGPWIEVTHGLDAGQKVVVSGTAVLSTKL